MSSPLSALPSCIRNNRSLHNVPTIGPVAVRMLDCIEAIHKKKLVVSDVKLENFMLRDPLPVPSLSSSSSSSSSSRAMAMVDAIVQSVRILDLGLLESFFSPMGQSGHRVDEYPHASVVGTPLYCSLNVMGGHTASRRDDLESLGYVVADLLLSVVNGGGESSSSSDFTCSLPWCHGKSDEEILQLKRSAVEETNDLYENMGGSDAIALKEYMEEVRDLGYAKTPRYDELREILGRIHGGSAIRSSSSASASASSSSRKKKKVAVTTRTSGSKRSSAIRQEDQGTVGGRTTRSSSTGAAAAAASAPTKRKIKKKHKPSSSPDVIAISEDDDVKGGGGMSSEEAESMDWEPESSDGENIENEAKKARVMMAPSAESSFAGATAAAPRRGGARKGKRKDPPLSSSSSTAKITAPTTTATTATARNKPYLKLKISDGPGIGTTYDLFAGTVVTVGSGGGLGDGDDGDNNKHRYISLGSSSDPDRVVGPPTTKHVKLEVSTKKTSQSVRVVDLQKKKGTTAASAVVVVVGGRRLSPGGSVQAFRGDRITIGDTTITITSGS